MNPPKKRPDTIGLRLKGPVKQVMETCYKAHQVAGIVVQGKIELSYSFYRFNSVIQFNEKGFKTSELLCGSDGRTENFYNDKHQVVESRNYDKAGVLQYTSIHTYNEQDLLTKYESTRPDGTLYARGIYNYNEDGQQIETYSVMGPEEKKLSHAIHQYNELKQHVACRQYNPDGSLKHTTTYKYNDKGQKIEELSVYVEERMKDYTGKRTFAYNEHGDVILTTTYDHEGNFKQAFPQTYEYDSAGNKILPERFDDHHTLKEGETETNELDANGNWIKKTVFFNKKATNIYERQIAYYGDASEQLEPFVHPLTHTTDVHIEEELDEDDLPEAHGHVPLTPEQGQWLVEQPNATTDNFSVLRYYVLRHGEAPSLNVENGPHIEATALRNQLMKYMDAIEVHSYSSTWNGSETLQRYTLAFPDKPYLVHAASISSAYQSDYEVPRSFSKILDSDYRLYFSPIHILRPSHASGKRDKNFERELTDYIDECQLQKVPDKPRIRIIEVRHNDFAMVERPVDNTFQINDLDVNYGSGFSKFHEELMQRFHTQSKGLVLFHGQPGTGKTYYIRHLLRAMAVGNRKIVIYMPPNMVDHLVEPAFMTFLAGEVQRWSSDGYFSVLLIEDAEPLLAKRQEGVRIQGVTNLLNMSDGLLNDMLNLQIICTFNVDLKKLDSALLRPGRLLARKEFKALSVLDANLLAQRLGIKHHFTAPATLAEVYSMGKSKNTLVHDVDSDQDSSTLIDDLLN